MNSFKYLFLLNFFLICYFVQCLTFQNYSTKYPWQDWTLPIEDRIENLISLLTVEEKAQQMVSMAPPVDRIGLKALNWRSECCHGYAFTGMDWKGSGWDGKATIYPHTTGMAATWHEDLVQAIGRATGYEGRAIYNIAQKQGIYGHMMTGLHCFGPTINVVRDPRWGRIRRTFGECPFLTGILGSAHTRGIQSTDSKYLLMSIDDNLFAVHDGPDSIRCHFNAEPSEQDLELYYLPSHRMIIQHGKITSVMMAYSRLNGIPDCCNKRLMTDIMKKEWGFDGYIFSDNTGVKMIVSSQHYVDNITTACLLAIQAGMDQDMSSGEPGDPWNYGGSKFQRELPKLVKSGELDEESLNNALRRIFRIRFRLGAEDPDDVVPWSILGPDVVGCKPHIDLTLRAALESMTLLKNAENTLPWTVTNIKTLLIAGPNANETAVLSGGAYTSFSISPLITVLKGVTDYLKKYSPSTKVLYANGCTFGVFCNTTDDYGTVLELAKESDAILFVGGIDGRLIEAENLDRGTEKDNFTLGVPCNGVPSDVIGMPGCQSDLIGKLSVITPNLVVAIMNGGPVTPQGGTQNAKAIIDMYYAGPSAGTALAQILFGDYNPAGRLPYTVYQHQYQLQNFIDYSMKERTYLFSQQQPMYRFGDGLSYTSFKHWNATLNIAVINPCDTISIHSSITNMGDRLGDEVWQLYVTTPNAPYPLRSLQSFSRVTLHSHQTITLGTTLTPWQYSSVLVDGSRVIIPGKYSINVGGCQPGTRGSGMPNPTSGENIMVNFVVEGEKNVEWKTCKNQDLVGKISHVYI